MRSWEMRVHGTPAPQGSKRWMPNGYMEEASKGLMPWREAIVSEVIRLGYGVHLNEPVRVAVTFLFKRPKAHYRTGKNAGVLREDAPTHVAKPPDVDKLLRSTFDGLTQSGIIADDSLIVSVSAVKIYSGVEEGPGAYITIQTLA